MALAADSLRWADRTRSHPGWSRKVSCGGLGGGKRTPTEAPGKGEWVEVAAHQVLGRAAARWGKAPVTKYSGS